MELHNSLTALLRRYDGILSIDDVCSFFEEDYSKNAILKFLAENEDSFTFDGDLITSYQIKIDIFLEELKILILKYGPSKEIIRFVVTEALLMFSEKHEFNKKYLPDFELKRTEDIFFETDVDDKLTWYEEFFSSDEKKYQFTSQLIEFLIAEEFTGSNIYSTPSTIVKLFRELLPAKNNLSLYNPTAGYLNLAIGLQVYSGSKMKICASEINKGIHYYGSLLATVNDIKVDFQHTDSGYEVDKLSGRQFDAIVSHLPFSVKVSNNGRKYRELSMHVISESIKKLNFEGRAVFLVNEGVLFSQSNEAIQFRKEVVDSGKLKSIISLPSNILLQTSVKSSLLVFDNVKRHDRIQFIDASSKSLTSVNPDNSISLNAEKIATIVGDEKSSDINVVEEDEVNYSKNELFLKVSLNDIQNHNYDLSRGKYVLEQKVYSDEYLPLRRVLMPKQTPLVPEGKPMPFIRISDLNSESITDLSGIGLNTTSRKGKLLNEPSILIGTIGDSFKPTYFDGHAEIEVSNNIAIFDFNKEKVVVPYLIQELNAEYVKKQMNLLARGSAMKHITIEDLLSVRIKVPSIKQQNKLILLRKSYSEEHKLEAKDEEKTISDAEIFAVFRHEIGNILEGPEGFLKQLPSFLTKNKVDVHKPIVENQPETFDDSLNSTIKSIRLIHWVLDNMKGVLHSNKEFFSPQITELKPFIEKCLQSMSTIKGFNWHVDVVGDFEGTLKVFAEIDRSQFENVIRNMVVNAIKHGKSDKPLNLVVQIIDNSAIFEVEAEEIQIEFINDGNPMPANFTLEDFIQFGKKAGSTKGQGLGGFLINQIVQNHSGEIRILPPGNNYAPVPTPPINKNVHFSISIPKTQ